MVCTNAPVPGGTYTESALAPEPSAWASGTSLALSGMGSATPVITDSSARLPPSLLSAAAGIGFQDRQLIGRRRSAW
ncbi:Uncharacterised protein [Mycobacteroides abscessus subsp. abscessus]|nr:Uncharacterised protein [Mycobacteroides abscessus subsp. abscessus]